MKTFGILLAALWVGWLCNGCMTGNQKIERTINWKLSDSMVSYDSVVITLTDTGKTVVYDTIQNGKLNNPSSLAPYTVPDSIPANFRVQIFGLDAQGDTLYASSFLVNADGKIVSQSPSLSQLLPTGLSFSAGTLVPGFSPLTSNYNLLAPYSASSLSVTATADSSVLLLWNGDTLRSDVSAGFSVPVGTTNFMLTLAAKDGSAENRITIKVQRAAGSEARLQSLAVGAAGLSPTFNPDSLSYALVLPADSDSVAFAPATMDSSAVLRVTLDSTALAPQNGGYEVLVPATGTVTLRFKVTSADQTTTKTYVIAVSRAASNDASLSNLGLSQGPLIPTFDPVLNTYYATVDTNSIALTATARHALAQITVNNNPVTSGVASRPIALLVGQNPIVVAVTAPDGKTKTAYTVTVERVSNNALLTNLALDSASLDSTFLPNRFSYRVTVPRVKSSLRLTAQAADANATVSVSLDSVTYTGTAGVYDFPLQVGDNLVQIKVVAASGDVDLYNLLVTRTPSANDTLKQMYFNKNNSLTPQILLNPIPNAFYTDTLAYTDSVLNFGPEPQDSNALVVMNYQQPAIVGQDTIYLPLETDSLPGGGTVNLRPPPGPSVISATVIAENRVAKLTYTIRVFHRYSNIASLSHLELMGANFDNNDTLLTLTPSFAYNVLSYSATTFGDSVQVRPTTSDSSAKVTVNGAPVPSGTLSASIAYPAYISIKIVVTAQDKTTTETYSLAVGKIAF